MRKGMFLQLVGLTCFLGLTLFNVVSCKQDEKEKPTDEPVYTQLDAVDVDYNSSGKYSTKIEIDDNSLKKEDLAIKYSYFDKDSYNNDLRAKANRDLLNPDDYYSIKDAKIDELKHNSDNTITVSYTDADAKLNQTDSYALFIESKKQAAEIQVNFIDFSLTPDILEVKENDKSIRVTIHNDNGEFEPNISKDLVSLGGSFENLTIASISNSSKNVTMQLTGNLSYNEIAGIYTDGSIYFKPEAIINCNSPVGVYIPVSTDSIYFDQSRLNYEDGIVTVPLISRNLIDTANIKKEDIKFEHSVEIVSLVNDDDEAYLVLNVKGATSKNTAAEILDGQNVKVLDHEFIASFEEASFYPVFDFIEKENDKFNINLKLYANTGKFNEKLTKDMIGLEDDFKDAEITKISLEDDTVAVVSLKLNANGMIVDNFKAKLTVNLAAGALINSWDEEQAPTSYTRLLDNSSIGKGIDPFSVVGLAVSVVSLIYSICADQSSGSVQDKILKAVEKNREIMQEEFKNINNNLKRMELKSDLREFEKFKGEITALELYVKKFNQTVNHAMDDFKKAKGIEHPEFIKEDGSNKTPELVEAWNKYYHDFYGVEYENGDKTKVKFVGYFRELINNGNYPEYTSFPEDFNNLQVQFINVSKNLEALLNDIDEILSHVYNSNIEANKVKYKVIINAGAAIKAAMTGILFYNGYEARDTWGSKCEAEWEAYNIAKNLIEAREEAYKDLKYKMTSRHVDTNNPIYIYSLHLSMKDVVINVGEEDPVKHPRIISIQRKYITDFFNRAKNKNLKQAFMDIGLQINNTIGLAINYSGIRKGDISHAYYWYYQQYDVIRWENTTINDNMECKRYHAKKGIRIIERVSYLTWRWEFQ